MIIIRFLRVEKEKQAEVASAGASDTGATSSSTAVTAPAKPEVQLRSITLVDFVKAKEEVSPSVSEDAFSIAEV